MPLDAVREFLGADLQDDDPGLALRVRQVKGILTTMANAVSAMKIFPSDHDTVKAFVDSLSLKFDDFLKQAPRLEVDVGEYSFSYAGRAVYADETTIKSLPFFFFKDGMEILYFFRGLDRPELFEFLELIKTVFQKPGEDNDIVAALWESDFANIQYYAPDEFLENRILAEKRQTQAVEDLPGLPSDLAHETVEVRVDRKKLSEGRIELRPGDRQRLDGAFEGDEAGAQIHETEFAGLAAAPDQSAGAEPGPSSMDAGLLENDIQELEALVRANRLLWPEEDFISLTAEIIFLEEDPAICAASLEILNEFLIDQIRAGQFPAASAIITEIRELRSHVGPGAGEKAALIDSSLKQMTGARTLGAVDAALGSSVPVIWPALLGFFKLLGPPALPTAAGLFERVADPEVRTRILEFIRDAGGPDPSLIIRLANDARPALSREIVGLLADLAEERGIPCMSAFLMFKNRDIKLEAIHALGRLHSEKANRILLGFLDDPDEDLRIQAALKLSPVDERSQIAHVITGASAPEFRKRSIKEKKAILSFLGRTRSAEALEFLTTVLGRTTLLPSSRNLEMRLAAVAGLESMGTEESSAALEAGSHGRGKKVRWACAEARARALTTAPPKP